MPSSPSKAKKPQDRKKPSAKHGSSWKKPLHDLELPSGETCQVKRPGVQGLIKANVLHSMDSLTSIVQAETLPKAQGKPVTNVQAIMDDPDKFNKMMETVDKIVIHVVTQPKLSSNLVPVLDENGDPKLDENQDPITRELELDEREDDVVYVDYVDQVDKMYIMNFAVGGSADLAQFRAETEALVGSVPDGEATEDSSE